MSKVIEKEKILAGNVDTELKDLFARSNIVDEENNEKLKELILKTEISDEKAIVNYLPNTLDGKRKLSEIIKKIKKSKQNEKELDIETSKKREVEINDKIRKKTFDENQDIDIELEIKRETERLKKEELKEKGQENDTKLENERNAREEIEKQLKLEEERKKEEEIEKEKEQEREKEEIKPKNKNDAQNEKELDIETEKEVRLHEQQKAEELEKAKTQTHTAIQEKEDKREEIANVIKETIKKHDKQTEKVEEVNTPNTDNSTNSNDKQWSVCRQRTANKSSGSGSEEGINFSWEFNGILTIIDGDKTTIETFTKNGFEKTFDEAKLNVLNAKDEFTKMCETIANSGDYNLLIRDPKIQDSLIMYEEGSYEDSIKNAKLYEKENSVEKSADPNSKSFVESLNSAKSEGRSFEGNSGRSIATESGSGTTSSGNNSSSGSSSGTAGSGGGGGGGV